jgi:hypothetical protein
MTDITLILERIGPTLFPFFFIPYHKNKEMKKSYISAIITVFWVT